MDDWEPKPAFWAKTKVQFKDKRFQLVLWYCYALVCVGMGASAPGPTLLILGEHTDSSTGALGVAVFSARSLGGLLGTVVGGFVCDKFPDKGNILIAASIIMNAICTAMIPVFGNLYFLSFVMACWGLSVGVLECGINLLTLWSYKKGVVDPYMHALHFGWGLGSFIAPILIAAWLAAHPGAILIVYVVIGVFYIPSGIAIIFYEAPKFTEEEESDTELEQYHPEKSPFTIGDDEDIEDTKISDELPLDLPKSAKSSKKPFTTREKFLIFHTAIFLFFYVGQETTCGGLISAYVGLKDLANPAEAAIVASVFWGALTFGRLIAIPISMYVKPDNMLIMNVAGCLVSIIFILIFTNYLSALIIGLIVFGLCNASSYGTVLNLAEQYMRVTGAAASWMIAGGSLEMFMPAIVSNLWIALGESVLFWWLLGTCIVLVLDLALLLWWGRKGGDTEFAGLKPDEQKMIGEKIEDSPVEPEEQNEELLEEIFSI